VAEPGFSKGGVELHRPEDWRAVGADGGRFGTESLSGLEVGSQIWVGSCASSPEFFWTLYPIYPWYQMVWQGIQRSSQWENETTRRTVSYCWQTSFIIWTHLSPTGEHTCFPGTATVNRSPHRHSSRCWLEAPAGSSTEKLAAESGRRHWPICWCCLDPARIVRCGGRYDPQLVKRSSEWVSEWVSISK